MNPTNEIGQPSYPTTQVGGLNPSQKKLIRILIIVVIIFVILIVASILWPKKFGVSSTNPSEKNVATTSPFFDIKFTKPLVSQGISVSSSPSIISSFKVSGKELDVMLKIPMQAGQADTITVNGVRDTQGVGLPTLRFSFTPKGVSPQNLPQDQQKAIVQQQVPTKPTIDDVNFVGTDGLLANGVSSSQVYDYEQAVFAFAPTVGNVSIDQATITPAPHDPESTSTDFAINFNVSIGTITYKAVLTYSNITAAQLTLYNYSTNATVFTSQTYDTAKAEATQ